MSRKQTEWGSYPDCPHCGFCNDRPDLTTEQIISFGGHTTTECEKCDNPFVVHWKVEIEYCGVGWVEQDAAQAQEGKP